MGIYEKPDKCEEYDPSPFIDDASEFYAELLSDDNLKKLEAIKHDNPSFYEYAINHIESVKRRIVS